MVKPSPRKLIAETSTIKTSPGKKDIHHAVVRLRWPAWII
jgi:hypothetical protein